jgi:hypothetical protein
MPSVRSKLSSTFTESAVAETVRKVNAQALALLTRRVEINRRIRSLHRVVHGLRDLATGSTTGDPRNAASTRLQRGNWTSHSEQSNENPETRDSKLSLEHTVRRMRPRLPGESKYKLALLSRACRIALMEAGNPAPLNEIRSRIDRRESFAFPDSESANAAVTQTLNIMKDSGEVRCVTSSCQSLWQRITPAAEIDNSR